MSSQAVSYNTDHGVQTTECTCGLRAKLRIAHTTTNYGRRFLGCPLYRHRDSRGCGYFTWVDPPFDTQASVVINQLLNQINDLNEKLKKKDEQIAGLTHKNAICGVAFILVLVLLGAIQKCL